MTGADHLLTIDQIEAAAKANMQPDVWDFFAGGAGEEATLRRNIEALGELWFRPRVVRDVEHRSTATSLFGVPLSTPVMVSPVGSIGVCDPSGATGAAQAAHAAGTSMFVSIVSRPALDEVAAQTDGPLFFQALIKGDDDWLKRLVGRVEAAGYRGMCVTTETVLDARRERDIVNGYTRHKSPPPNIAVDPGDPVAIQRFTWEGFDRLRAMTEMPLIIKGIMAPEDAELAVEHGADAVYVCNHGGRSLDYTMPTIEALPAIADVVGGRVPILFDGGIRHGGDVVKALALGADVCLIGKLQCWGMAAAGPAGLQRVLEILTEEISITMGLLGLTEISQIDKECLAPRRR